MRGNIRDPGVHEIQQGSKCGASEPELRHWGKDLA
jgi:hypothetical protein